MVARSGPWPRAADRPRRSPGRLSAVAALATLTVLGTGSAAHAAAPPPCNGVPQITDVRGDGHHPNADVTAAWFSESAGRLQAVVQMDVADWKPAHEDSVSAGAALIFGAGGAQRYVRVQTFQNDTQQYDYGVWTRAGGFQSQGATTGTVIGDTGGTVTIDVPAASGATAGVTLGGPYVLTYDGGSGTDLHWVDRAPGGVSPDTTETGADYVVGSCGAVAAPGPGGTPTIPGGPAAPAATTTSVAITARRLLVGGGTVKVTGKASPGRAGVPVLVTTTGTRTRTTTTTTRASGAWSVRVPIAETSTVKATVEGVGSQTKTIDVRSTVRILKVARRAGRRYVVTGRVSPSLPGRVLLLRTDAVRPTKTVKARSGRFTVALTSPKRGGRYQAVFIPTGERAERSTSNTKRIR
ncbi:hypothetical protein AB0L40_23810 [Patulibacter sp. NPDC049589]|uniref:hypothetical protein n=1 Tax=Patulibacter sp. NPDC049589 TaxID=3154731 RepID=UPI003448357D